jgi:DNA topoisomerase VI subunit B
VDDKSIPIGAGTELSFLNVKAQSQVNDYLERELCTVTEKQAAEIHKLYEQENLSEKALSEILGEKEDNEKFSVDTKKLRSYFPKEYSSAQCKKILWEILDAWVREKDVC